MDSAVLITSKDNSNSLISKFKLSKVCYLFLILFIGLICGLLLLKLISNHVLNFESEKNSNFDERMKKEFKRFQKDFGKIYCSEEEKNYRFELFKVTFLQIEEFNEKKFGSSVRINQFSDLSDEEFGNIYLSNFSQPLFHSNKKVERNEDLFSFSEENMKRYGPTPTPNIDWVAKGKVAGIKDQAMCGSCWAFSAIGAIESLHAIHTNSLVTFSEQQLIDCCISGNTDGCNGGYMTDAFPYVSEHGISYEKDYPYLAYQQDKCYPFTSQFKIEGFKKVDSEDNDALFEALQDQPISIAVNAESFGFRYYSGGYLETPCAATPNHAVLLVGGGHDEYEGVDYWMIKNSWGPTWGYNGYIYIERQTGKGPGLCGLAMYPSYPILKQAD